MIYAMSSNEIICELLEFLKLRDRELILRNNGWELSEYEESYGYPSSWSSKVIKQTPLKISSLRLIIIHLSKLKEKNLKRSKRKEAYNLKGTSYKAISGFLSTLWESEMIIQSAHRKKNLPNKNTLFNKVILQKWRRDKRFPHTNKSQGSWSPPDLPHKKCRKKFFKLKLKDSNW